MTALAAARSSIRQDEHVIPPVQHYPVKATTQIYQGGLVALNAGYLVPAASTAGLIAVGVAEESVLGGATDGAVVCRVRAGVYGPFANSAAGEALAAADLGKPCYIADDQTVQKTGAGVRSIAGLVFAVETAGVYVLVAPIVAQSAQEYPVFAVSISVPALANIANSDVIFRWTNKLGRSVRIKAVQFQTTVVASTASRAATLTTKIGTTAATGGVLSLTTAACDTEGKVALATDVTALNVAAADADVILDASAVTAFAEGAGVITVLFG